MEFLITKRDDAVLTVKLNNPPFNFLTTPLMIELEEVLTRVDKDPGIRAVVLTSAVPDVFVSHYSVEEILDYAQRIPITASTRMVAAGLRLTSPLRRIPTLARLLDRTPAAGLSALLRYHAIVRRIRDSDTVFIAAVTGHALGGGCELTLACDIRIMADGPYLIGQPEIVLGLLPGGGGTQMLVRAIGTSAALDIVLEGRPLTPREALDIGLVQRLADPNLIIEEAHRTAARLARRSRAAVRAIKYAVHTGGSQPLAKGLKGEQARFLALASRPETKNAMGEYAEEVRRSAASGKSVADFVVETLPAWIDGTAAEFAPRQDTRSASDAKTKEMGGA